EQVGVVGDGEFRRLGEDRPPALGVVDLGRAQRDHQQAQGGDQPEQAQQDHHDLDDAAAQAVDDAGDDASLRRAGVAARRRGRRRRRHCEPLLNLRMFMIMKGRTRTSRKTASALPSPWWFPPPNDTRHISSAITFASGWTEGGAMMNTRSNTFKVLMIIVTKTTSSTGDSSGTVILRNTCHSVAP